MKEPKQEGSKAYLSLLNREGVKLVASGINAAWKKFRECSNKDKERPFCILDIGCGDGSYWRLVQKHLAQPDEPLPPHDLVLVDLSDSCRDECKDNQLPTSEFHCLKFPFSGPIKQIKEKTFDLVVFSAVFHELRLQASSDRLNSDKAATLSLTDLVGNLFSNLLDRVRLSESACILVGDLGHQPYWHLEALNLARVWQASDLPKHLGVTTGGHADPAFAFLRPREIVLGATNSDQFYLEDHKECQSLPNEYRDMPLICYSPEPLTVRSVVRSREFFLLTFRRKATRDSSNKTTKFAHESESSLSFQGELREPLASLRRALENWNETRAKEIEQIFRHHIGGLQPTSQIPPSSNKTLFSVTVDRVSRITKEICLQCGVMPPRLMSHWPSVKSRLLNELGLPYRFLTTSVFGSDYDGQPFVVSDSRVSIESDWVSICYDSLFLQQKFEFADNWLEENIKFPSLFTAMTSKNVADPHSHAPRSLALVVQPSDPLAEAEFFERLREYQVVNHSDKASPGHWVLILESPCRKKSPLSNARKIDAFFNNRLSGDEPLLRSVHLSILELYLDFLFVAAGSKYNQEMLDSLNSIKSKWCESSWISCKNDLNSIKNTHSPMLPKEYKGMIQFVGDTLATYASRFANRPPISAWHLIPGSSFINPDDVTGNLMILADQVIPAPASDKVRELHDEMLNLFQRVDDEAVLIRTNYLQRQHAIKSARAAIMSRNLSHNVGSHALANSRFYESLGVLHKVSRKPIESAEANPANVTEGEIWRARDRLGEFNGYLQGKMDFIARALGDTSNIPEPLFLVGDVLKGFLSQRVLLNTLLSDNGLEIDNLRFELELPGRGSSASPITIRYDPVNGTVTREHRHYNFKARGGEEDDYLVAIPGGMIGRHALYAFLENVLRNAAKYGSEREIRQDLTVRLRLRDGYALDRNDVGSADSVVPCYWLECVDDWSLTRPGAGLSDGTPDGMAAETGAENVGPVCKALWKIRSYLNDSIIDDEGKAQTVGHGIQEMKVCCEFMAGESLVFPPDDKWLEQGWKERIGAIRHAGSDSKDPYTEFISDSVFQRDLQIEKKKRTAWIGQENPLQAFSRSEEWPGEGSSGASKKKTHLAYRLIVQKPILFGIVNCCDGVIPQEEAIRPSADNPAVNYYRDIQTLSEQPAHFGLILVNSGEQIESVLQQVAAHHFALPYRLMIVLQASAEEPSQDAKPSLLEEWRDAIRAKQANPDGGEARPFGPNCPIPIGRVFAVACGELFDETCCGKTDIPRFDAANTAACRDNGLNIFQAVYETWLKAWKGPELKKCMDKSWYVCVGFQRDGTDGAEPSVWERWKVSKQFVSPSNLVKVLMGISSKRDEHNANFDPKKTLPGNRCQLVVYSNHGAGLDVDNWQDLLNKDDLRNRDPHACNHSFSGSGQIDLFHSLETPPQDSFGFAFFIYSLLEASLLKVAVIDERVAEAMIEPDSDGRKDVLQEKHKNLLFSRIFPVFQVGKKSNSGIHPLSPEVRSVMQKDRSPEPAANASEIDAQEQPPPQQDEGLVLDPNHPRLMAMYGEQTNARENGPFDAVIVHEGVLDTLPDRWWSREIQESLYALTPFFVRTSGRGSLSRHDGDHLPFMEFSELSQSTYQSQNKLALGRTLLSIRGGKRRSA